MLKDIPVNKVEHLGIAVIPPAEIIPGEEPMWDVFLLNLNVHPIKNVLINSSGYGEMNGEVLKTTILRHYFEEITGETAVQIEPIQGSLFGITNEYWISFSQNDYMYDKRYIFVPGSIHEDFLTFIPVIEKQGVLIR